MSYTIRIISFETGSSRKAGMKDQLKFLVRLLSQDVPKVQFQYWYFVFLAVSRVLAARNGNRKKLIKQKTLTLTSSAICSAIKASGWSVMTKQETSGQENNQSLNICNQNLQCMVPYKPNSAVVKSNTISVMKLQAFSGCTNKLLTCCLEPSMSSSSKSVSLSEPKFT
jgi:hypothetical protein